MGRIAWDGILGRKPRGCRAHLRRRAPQHRCSRGHPARKGEGMREHTVPGPHIPPKPTPRTPTFDGLISQLESAIAPIWGMSLDIAILMGWQYKPSGRGWATYINPDGVIAGMPLHYTASLDHALTLGAPPGHPLWLEDRSRATRRRHASHVLCRNHGA